MSAPNGRTTTLAVAQTVIARAAEDGKIVDAATLYRDRTIAEQRGTNAVDLTDETAALVDEYGTAQ